VSFEGYSATGELVYVTH